MKTVAAIPVLHVADLDAAVRYYTEVLGFTQSFHMGTYCGFKLGECEIHVCPPGDRPARAGGGAAYVICDEIDRYFAAVKAAGARVKAAPGNRLYGMRDFTVVDPEGNQISFGCDIERN